MYKTNGVRGVRLASLPLKASYYLEKEASAATRVWIFKSAIFVLLQYVMGLHLCRVHRLMRCHKYPIPDV